ncbi:MAG: hypothetical protein ABFD82_20090 [Syntrophaceae bacterium]
MEKGIIIMGKEQLVPTFMLDWIRDADHIKNIGSRIKVKGSRFKGQGTRSICFM